MEPYTRLPHFHIFLHEARYNHKKLDLNFHLVITYGMFSFFSFTSAFSRFPFPWKTYWFSHQLFAWFRGSFSLGWRYPLVWQVRSESQATLISLNSTIYWWWTESCASHVVNMNITLYMISDFSSLARDGGVIHRPKSLKNAKHIGSEDVGWLIRFTHSLSNPFRLTSFKNCSLRCLFFWDLTRLL